MQLPNIYTCPHCGEAYILGVNGIESGCDACEGVVRNPIDNTIVEVNVAFAEVEE